MAGQGDNIERFLMGRQVGDVMMMMMIIVLMMMMMMMVQVFVVCLVFFAAKLTTIHGRSETGETDFLFYVPAWVQVSWDWSTGGEYYCPLIG